MESITNQLIPDISPPINYTFKEIVSHISITQDWKQAAAIYIPISTQTNIIEIPCGTVVRVKTRSPSFLSVTNTISFEGACLPMYLPFATLL